MEKILKLVGKIGGFFSKLVVVFLIAIVVIFILTEELNTKFYQQEKENNAWMTLKQPSDNELVNTMYDFLLTDQVTLTQRLASWKKITKLVDESYEWDNYMEVYLSRPEKLQLILEGKLNPREMIIEVDCSWQWMNTALYLTIFIWIFCIFLSILMLIIYWTISFWAKRRKKLTQKIESTPQ